MHCPCGLVSLGQGTLMAGGGIEVDAAAQAFTAKVFGMIAGGISAFTIDLGLRTGLFDAASGAGPLTSDELALRAGLDERYVREWLAAMTTAGVFRLDGDRFELPLRPAPGLRLPHRRRRS